MFHHVGMSDRDDPREHGLLAWQWAGYRDNHVDRGNLAIHAVAVPLFLAGNVVAIAGPLLGPGWLVAVGLLGMVVSLVAQGRAHRREVAAPVAFRGPRDVLFRILAEQWITFPRYVLTGAFFRAWRWG